MFELDWSRLVVPSESLLEIAIRGTVRKGFIEGDGHFTLLLHGRIEKRSA